MAAEQGSKPTNKARAEKAERLANQRGRVAETQYQRAEKAERALDEIADGSWGRKAQQVNYDVAEFARAALRPSEEDSDESCEGERENVRLRQALWECLSAAENNNEMSEIQRLKSIHTIARTALAAPQPPLARDPEWPDLPQEC